MTLNTSWPIKDPDEVWDLSVDWSPHLENTNDTIATSQWEVPEGLFSELESSSTTTATIWISGGTHGIMYTLKNTIETAQGRTWVGRLKIVCRNKYFIVNS